jgi:hypothetical protein
MLWPSIVLAPIADVGRIIRDRQLQVLLIKRPAFRCCELRSLGKPDGKRTVRNIGTFPYWRQYESRELNR